MKENVKIKEAQNEYEYLTGDEAKQRWEELHDKYEHDRATLIYESKEEGREQGKEEIAQRLLKKGLTVEEVQDITGLSKERVESLVQDKR